MPSDGVRTMRFKLRTVADYYNELDRERMVRLGFTMTTNGDARYGMHDALVKSGDPEIDVDSIEELMEFVLEHGDVIVSADRSLNHPYGPVEPPTPSITIYDDYDD